MRSRRRWPICTSPCWTKRGFIWTASPTARGASTSCFRSEGAKPEGGNHMTHVRRFRGLWMAPLVLAASLPAATLDGRLLEAAKNSDKVTIQALLPQHVDLNVADPDGATALHWAVRHDDLETASLLLRGG